MGESTVRRLAAVVAVALMAVGALAAPVEAAVPTAPEIVEWYEGPGEVAIIWRAPSSTGGKAITSYRVDMAPSGQVFELPVSDVRIPGTPYYGVLIYGAMNGWSETYTVRARNADGYSAASPGVTLTPTGCRDTPFSDVSSKSQFCGDIAWLFLSGISTGTDTGYSIEFRPSTRVSRSAMAAFIHRLFGEPRTTLTEPFFVDVGPSHQFYEAIQWMAESGLSTGTAQSGGRKPLYKPSDGVSRGAMAAFLNRAAGSPTTTLTQPFFADVGRGNAFYDAIQWMGETGISTGTAQSGGRKPLYKPSDVVSRSAMAAFLHRWVGVMISADGDAVAPLGVESGDVQSFADAGGPTAWEGRTAPVPPGLVDLP